MATSKQNRPVVKPVVKIEEKKTEKESKISDYVVNVDTLTSGKILTRVKKGTVLKKVAVDNLKNTKGRVLDGKEASLFECLCDKEAIVTKSFFDAEIKKAEEAAKASS